MTTRKCTRLGRALPTLVQTSTRSDSRDGRLAVLCSLVTHALYEPIAPRDGPRQVTFRVTSRWQNPKTVVNGRKNLKNLGARKRLISQALCEFRPFCAHFTRWISGLPLSPPILSNSRQFISHQRAPHFVPHSDEDLATAALTKTMYRSGPLTWSVPLLSGLRDHRTRLAQ